MLTHLLDTSAWIAHLQNEAAGKIVVTILNDPENEVGISVLSLVELHARLKAFGRLEEFRAILADYREVFVQLAPVDETIALRAVSLRQSAKARIPTVDAMIAATAAHHGAILVHRDPHFTALPADQVRQQALIEF